MTRYYCDYCDVYLTHDAPRVRRDHNAGWKHAAQVKAYILSLNQDRMARQVGEIIKDYEARGEMVPVPAPTIYRGPGAGPGGLAGAPPRPPMGMMGPGPVPGPYGAPRPPYPPAYPPGPYQMPPAPHGMPPGPYGAPAPHGMPPGPYPPAHGQPPHPPGQYSNAPYTPAPGQPNTYPPNPHYR